MKLTSEELTVIDTYTGTAEYKVKEIIAGMPEEYRKSAVEICKCYAAAEQLHKIFGSKKVYGRNYDEALSIDTLFNALHRSTHLQEND